MPTKPATSFWLTRMQIAAICAVYAVGHSCANPWYVATNGVDDGTHDGLSWDQPFATISNAVAKSSSGNTIIVSNGTYKLNERISLYGSKTRHLKSLRGADETILDGQGLCGIIWMTGGSIDGFTCTNGSHTANGGAIEASIVSTGARIQNCIIVNCRTDLSGGGISLTANNDLWAANTVISNVTFIGNEANSSGGGVYLRCNQAVIIDCQFYDNYTTKSDSILGGGGLYAGSYTNSIIGCSFKRNSGSLGGGIYARYGYADTMFISNCVFENNSSFHAVGGGGVNLGMGGTITHCTMVSNNTKGSGGGVYAPASDGKIHACRLEHNTSSKLGGGIYAGGEVRNLLIAGNAATNQGGGIYLAGGQAQNCTIADNIAVTNTGGGLFLSDGVVENSIIYFNTAASGGSNWVYTAGYFTNTCTAPSVADYGAGNITDDPLFADASAGDYHLRSRSPCINNGLHQEWMEGALDLDANPRIRQWIVDMGAFECLRDGTVFTIK